MRFNPFPQAPVCNYRLCNLITIAVITLRSFIPGLTFLWQNSFYKKNSVKGILHLLLILLSHTPLLLIIYCYYYLPLFAVIVRLGYVFGISFAETMSRSAVKGCTFGESWTMFFTSQNTENETNDKYYQTLLNRLKWHQIIIFFKRWKCHE